MDPETAAPLASYLLLYARLLLADGTAMEVVAEEGGVAAEGKQGETARSVGVTMELSSSGGGDGTLAACAAEMHAAGFDLEETMKVLIRLRLELEASRTCRELSTVRSRPCRRFRHRE